MIILSYSKTIVYFELSLVKLQIDGLVKLFLGKNWFPNWRWGWSTKQILIQISMRIWLNHTNTCDGWGYLYLWVPFAPLVYGIDNCVCIKNLCDYVLWPVNAYLVSVDVNFDLDNSIDLTLYRNLVVIFEIIAIIRVLEINVHWSSIVRIRNNSLHFVRGKKIWHD